MVHSNIFGRGLSEKKIELIMEELPTILVSTVSQKEKINEISKVKGMATKSAENFVEKIDAFKSFLQEIGLSGKLSSLDDEDVDSSNANTDTSHPLYKKNIVMTGARDKELMEELKKVGANITSVVNKNTFALIAKDKDEHSNKLEDAVKLQIPIFSIDEFKQDYLEQIDK
jgi:NAD-dependent DNA ligase